MLIFYTFLTYLPVTVPDLVVSQLSRVTENLAWLLNPDPSVDTLDSLFFLPLKDFVGYNLINSELQNSRTEAF